MSRAYESSSKSINSQWGKWLPCAYNGKNGGKVKNRQSGETSHGCIWPAKELYTEPNACTRRSCRVASLKLSKLRGPIFWKRHTTTSDRPCNGHGKITERAKLESSSRTRITHLTNCPSYEKGCTREQRPKAQLKLEAHTRYDTVDKQIETIVEINRYRQSRSTTDQFVNRNGKQSTMEMSQSCETATSKRVGWNHPLTQLGSKDIW